MFLLRRPEMVRGGRRMRRLNYVDVMAITCVRLEELLVLSRGYKDDLRGFDVY